MKEKRQIISGIVAVTGMFILIIDTKTAFSGAEEGLRLCVQTVIPSLFPFFVISNMIVPLLSGTAISRFLRGIGRFCGIPEGAEGLLIIGCVGGYPIGAQSIAQAYHCGMLSKSQAGRMLGFCCNAGPSFLFGMAAALFPDAYMAWLLWGIHILCAMLIGRFLPGRRADITVCGPSPQAPTWVSSMVKGLRSMAVVCGWVILFRVVLSFIRRWALWLLPGSFATALTGFLELTNGCVQLEDIPSVGLRFCLCAAFLGWGGACVGMQTVSALGSLGTGLYFPGKAIHAMVSFVLAYVVQAVLFMPQHRFRMEGSIYWLCILCVAALSIFMLMHKNCSRNPESIRV